MRSIHWPHLAPYLVRISIADPSLCRCFALFGRVQSIRSIGFRNELGIEINGEILHIESNYHAYLGEVVAFELNMEECQLIPRLEPSQSVSPSIAKDLIHLVNNSLQASAN